ncbi:hypothetical protein HAZELMIKA_35 [Klebsiella phage vB_KaeD_HazelMika]|nr:hypothetical protein HAZELMIKA_35 [Klebsiella phage vB_KaeD_HazelMika]
MKRTFDYSKTVSTYNFTESRGKILMPHLLRLAQSCAREAIALGDNGGFDEAIAVVYLRAAYGHEPVGTLEQMATAFNLHDGTLC